MNNMRGCALHIINWLLFKNYFTDFYIIWRKRGKKWTLLKFDLTCKIPLIGNIRKFKKKE